MGLGRLGGPSYSISFGWPGYYGYPYYAYPYYAAPYYPPYAYAPAYAYPPANSYAPNYSYAPNNSYAPSDGYPPPQGQQQAAAYNAPAMQTWYYCERPRGYYPQVKSCNGGWHQVQVQPMTSTGQPP